MQAIRTISVAALLFIAAMSDCTAQSVTARFGHVSTEEGLSNPNVYDVVQDPDGFMWFATESGLNRFDGSAMRQYYFDPADSTSLPDNWVTSLDLDASGNIWVGTRYGGVARLDRDTGAFTRFAFESGDAAHSLLSAYACSVLVDRAGQVWIGTNGGGIGLLDPSTGTFTHFLPDSSDTTRLSGDTVFTLYEDRSGNVWAGTWKFGLNLFERESDTFRRFKFSHAEGYGSLDRIRAMEEDRLGNFWIGTVGGLIQWDRDSDSRTIYRNIPSDPNSLADNKAYAVAEDNRGRIWIGTYDGGLHRYDPQTGIFTRFQNDPEDRESLSGSIVHQLFVDRDGLLWIATDRGLSTYDVASEGFVVYRHDRNDPQSLSSSDVRSLAWDNVRPDRLWIGTTYGLNLLDLDSGRIQNVIHGESDAASIAGEEIFAIDQDSKGRLWLGFPNQGVGVWDPRSESARHYPRLDRDSTLTASSATRSLIVDRNDVVWVGTDGAGLYRLDPSTDSVRRFRESPGNLATLSDDNVSALFESSAGDIWIGTFDGGVNRLDPRTGVVTRINLAGDARAAEALRRVTSFAELDDGFLYVGTYGGLVRIDPSGGQLRIFSRNDELPSAAVLGMAPAADGSLWLQMQIGISRLDPETSRFQNFGSASGLPDLQSVAGAILSARDELLVGMRDGLLRFNTGSLRSHRTTVLPIITSVTTPDGVVQTDVFDGGEIRLSYRDAYFTFDLALLSYARPEFHRFEFLLEGYDGGTRTTGGTHPKAEYSNVAPGRTGTFPFRVRGSVDGVTWTESTVSVVITPPWWRAEWFIALVSVSLIALAGTVVWQRRERLRAREFEKKKMLSESRERERLLITRVIHDAPLQNLYAVRHMIDRITAGNGAADETAGDAIRLIQETTDELRNLIGELRPPTIGTFGISSAIRDHVRVLVSGHEDTEIHFNAPEEEPKLPEHLKLVLFRIYQGAISNALRHADASMIDIGLSFGATRLSMTVEDDGRGFVVPGNWMILAREEHYGLLGISEWVASLEGTLRVDSAPGKGTRIQVDVPFRAEREKSIFGRLAAAFKSSGSAPPDTMEKPTEAERHD